MTANICVYKETGLVPFSHKMGLSLSPTHTQIFRSVLLNRSRSLEETRLITEQTRYIFKDFVPIKEVSPILIVYCQGELRNTSEAKLILAGQKLISTPLQMFR